MFTSEFFLNFYLFIFYFIFSLPCLMFIVGYFLVLLSVLCVPDFYVGGFLNPSWGISYLM